MITEKSSDNAIKEMLEKALVVYGLPEKCLQMALVYIDGAKMGAEACENEYRIKNTAITK